MNRFNNSDFKKFLNKFLVIFISFIIFLNFIFIKNKIVDFKEKIDFNKNNLDKNENTFKSVLKKIDFKDEKSYDFFINQRRLISKGNITSQILFRKYYTVGYAEIAVQPEWTSYFLSRKMLEIGRLLVKEKKVSRPNFFFEDKEIIGIRATLKDFFKSGFDRGHLVPSSDMSFSKESIKETFLLSNISPQSHNFNAGIWLKLEELVRKIVKEKNEIFILSAGILTKGNKTIGLNKIWVPDFFYKIIIVPDVYLSKVIGFIVPHSIEKKRNIDLTQYIVLVKDIEVKTKINFFDQFSEEIKKKILNSKDLVVWQKFMKN